MHRQDGCFPITQWDALHRANAAYDKVVKQHGFMDELLDVGHAMKPPSRRLQAKGLGCRVMPESMGGTRLLTLQSLLIVASWQKRIPRALGM